MPAPSAASTTLRLATPEDIAAYAGVDSISGPTEALLGVISDGISQAIERAIGRRIGVHPATAHYTLVSHTDATMLGLDEYPVRRVTSLSEGSASLVEGDDYRIVPPPADPPVDVPGSVERLRGGAPGAFWLTGLSIVVQYEAGYDEPPSDLRLAAAAQGAFEFAQTRAGGGRLGLASKAPPGGAGESVALAEHAWLPLVREVIASYRPQRAA